MIDLKNVAESLDLVNDYHQMYLHRETGEVVMVAEEDLEAIESETNVEELAAWQQEAIQKAQEAIASEDYVAFPDRFEIDEYSIMERFCNNAIDDLDLGEELLILIQGSGAFGRFRDAIHRHGIAEDWYRYKQAALEDIAAEWLDIQNIAYKRVAAEPVAVRAKTFPPQSLEGTWHIYEMEQWDEDYFNMEVQAHVTVTDQARGMGHFQFGLVSGHMDAETVHERFEFTWEGNDECDEAFGSGWLKLVGADELRGRFKFHEGDSSTFSARRA